MLTVLESWCKFTGESDTEFDDSLCGTFVFAEATEVSSVDPASHKSIMGGFWLSALDFLVLVNVSGSMEFPSDPASLETSTGSTGGSPGDDLTSNCLFL